MLPYKSSSLVQNVFAVHRFAQRAADWRSGPRWSILSMLCSVHPFPLRGTSPRWEACHWIRGSRGSPMNPVPLPPPQFGGAAKGKRLNGQARRLTSPHLEVLCRTSTGDYKAPLCCELLMKRVFRGVLFCPPDGGKVRRSRIRGSRVAANHQNANQAL